MSSANYNAFSQDFKVGYLYGALEIMFDQGFSWDEYIDKAVEIVNERGINLDLTILKNIAEIYALYTNQRLHEGKFIVVAYGRDKELLGGIGIDEEGELETIDYNYPYEEHYDYQENGVCVLVIKKDAECKCGKACFSDDICGHGIASGICCVCEECLCCIDDDQDDFTNRVCENCSKEFDLSDPHYYDGEQGVCYCSEECYIKCSGEEEEGLFCRQW